MNLQVASQGSAWIYPLFSDPSEGSSYPDLGSSPGPFLWHNYQPDQNLWVASQGSARIYPLFSDPSEGSSYPDLGSSPGPFLWHNYQPDQNLWVASWGSARIYPLFSYPSEGSSYPDLGSNPFLWHNYQPVRIYGWHHGNQPGSIRYSVIHSLSTEAFTEPAWWKKGWRYGTSAIILHG